MGMLSRTKKRGKKLFGWLCCIDDGKEKPPEEEKKRKNVQDQNDQNTKRKRRRLPKMFICHDHKKSPNEENMMLDQRSQQEGSGEKRMKKKRKRKLVPKVFSRNKKLTPKDESNAPVTVQEGETRNKKRRKLPNASSRNGKSPKDETSNVSEDAQFGHNEQKRKKRRRKFVKLFHRNKKKSSEGNLATTNTQEEDVKAKDKTVKKMRVTNGTKDGDMLAPKVTREENEKKNNKKKKKRRRIKFLFRKKSDSKVDSDMMTKNSEEKGKKKRRRKILFRKDKAPKVEGESEGSKKKKKSKTSTNENKIPGNVHEDNKEKKKRRWRRTLRTSQKRKRKMKIRLWRKKKKQKNKTNHLSSLISTMTSISDNVQQTSAVEEILRLGSTNIPTRVFTLRELAAATRNFHSENLLGEGGFGKVFKGQLKDTNETVAVKQLDKNGYQGNREFLVEVLMLSLLHHPNLVKLIGYCVEDDERILIYEYMPLGSLEDHLLDISAKSKPLDWQTRMKIAAGAARGLEYLHDSSNPPVIYRDLKASNILLDEDFNPKLSDFGLARVGPTGDKSHVSTRVMGTYGYCAPEYALTGQLTKMSDVYSFGVVLLEIITGRRAVDTTKPKKEQILVHWAEPMFKDKRKFDIADPLLEGRYPVKGLCQAVAVAAMCLQHEAAIRPLIRDIVTALDYLANPNYEVLTGSRESIPRTLLPTISSRAPEETARTSDDMLVSESTTYPESFSSSDKELDDGIVINLPYPP